MVVAVLFSLLLMVVDHRTHYLDPVRSVLAVTTYPLHYLANLPFSAADSASEALASRAELQQAHDDYRLENLRLKGQLQKFEALEAENMRLRDLLDSSLKIGDQVLVAELIAIDLDPYKQQVLIDRGSSSGVFLGQPVLDANAVMGQVIHVSPMTSTVLMITDPTHALPVQVNRSGLRTIANGTGRINELELPHLPNNADIHEGDLLVTSGLGGHFPPGYPVAQVTQVTREPGQPFARVLATPNAHLERVREVLLVRTLLPAHQEEEKPEPEATTEAVP